MQGNSNTRGVYVYQYSGNWSLKGSPITKEDVTFSEGTLQALGASARISDDGNRVVIADPYFDSSVGTDAGALFVFDYIGGNWVQNGDVFLPNKTDGVTSASYVGEGINSMIAISGNGVVIGGASIRAGAGVSQTGVVWTFKQGSDGPSISTEYVTALDVSAGTVNMLSNTMDVSSGVVDVSGTTWMNRGQSSGTIADAYQCGLVIESNKTSADDAVLHIETAGQTQAFSVRADGSVYADNALSHSSDDRKKPMSNILPMLWKRL